jgi:hypothetical protein
MAYTYSVNNTPSTGAVAMYTLISTLVSAGWTQVDSSDGTTRGAAQVTGGGTGTHGLGNNNAWVRLAAPSVNGGAVSNQVREFTFQRGTADRDWRIKYSASATFSGGSPSNTATPDATDEVFMTGGGTSASPTFTTSWLGANGTYRWHVACGGSAEFYSFYAKSLTTGTTTYLSGMFLDVMATGSYPSSDVDPAVVFCSAASTGYGIAAVFAYTAASAITTVTNPSLARAWMGSTSAAGASTSSNSVNIAMIAYGAAGAGGLGSGTIGTNPFSSKDDLVPCWWGRNGASTAPIGVKGCSTLFMYGSVARTSMDTCDTVSTGSKDKSFVGGTNVCVWDPWSGATPTI